MTKNISLEHSIRKIMSGQNVQVDESQLDEFQLPQGLKQTGMNAIKNLLKPQKKPSVPQVPKPEIAPEVKPETPPELKPELKPEVKPNVTTGPATAPTTPDAKPEAKPDQKSDPKAPAPPQSAQDQKVDDKNEDEKRRRRELDLAPDSPATTQVYKKTRVPVSTAVGIAKKRRVFEELETKNRKLVGVVKKTLDDKKKKNKQSSSNPMVDMHPELKDVNQDTQV